MNGLATQSLGKGGKEGFSWFAGCKQVYLSTLFMEAVSVEGGKRNFFPLERYK
jgi:hypothetical protein